MDYKETVMRYIKYSLGDSTQRVINIDTGNLVFADYSNKPQGEMIHILLRSELITIEGKQAGLMWRLISDNAKDVDRIDNTGATSEIKAERDFVLRKEVT